MIMPIKFCSETYFVDVRSFNEPEVYRLKFLPADLCAGLLRPQEMHQPLPGLNFRTLGLKASTLFRDHRDRPSRHANKITNK